MAILEDSSVMRFGLATGPIFLDDMMCEGNESSLVNCPREHNCIHEENAGVICQVDGKYVAGSLQQHISLSCLVSSL